MPKAVKADNGAGQAERIVKMKDTDGKTWAEISDAVGIAQGKCMSLYEQHNVTPKTKITAKTEDELRQKIAQARTDGLSWGIISARSGKSEGFCKKAFQEITGENPRGHRIGKGGRYPDGEAPEGKPVKVKGAIKKGGAKPEKVSGAVKKAKVEKPIKKVGKKVAKKIVKKAAAA